MRLSVFLNVSIFKRARARVLNTHASVFIKKITLRFSENGCYFTLSEMAARFPINDQPTPYFPKRDRDESDEEEILPMRKSARRLSSSSEDSIIPPNRVLAVS